MRTCVALVRRAALQQTFVVGVRPLNFRMLVRICCNVIAAEGRHDLRWSLTCGFYMVQLNCIYIPWNRSRTARAKQKCVCHLNRNETCNVVSNPCNPCPVGLRGVHAMASRIIVKNLPKHASDARLREKFAAVGEVTDCRIQCLNRIGNVLCVSAIVLTRGACI